VQEWNNGVLRDYKKLDFVNERVNPYTTTWKLFSDTNSSLGGSKTVNLSTNARKK